jgi:Flp pilus assembly protein TadG
MTTARASHDLPRAARQLGGAVVEFALLLTFMISLLAMIFEIGRAFWYYEALSKATRNGARAAAVSAKATIATTGVAAAQALVVAAATSARVPSFTDANVTVTCLDSSLNDAVCTNGTAPTAVRVAISAYTIQLGDYIPFLAGGVASYTVTMAPSATMPYML